jgi:hypothetical protein
MGISTGDREILRRLAAEQAAIAALPVQEERQALWRRLNNLERVRPLVWINEVCWPELAGEEELTLRCADETCRGIERGLRALLYQWHHFPGDMIVDPVYYAPIVVHDTGFGLRQQGHNLNAYAGSVASQHFDPCLKEPADVEKIQSPVVTLDAAETDRRFSFLSELFAGVLPVVKRGFPGTWFAPWDELIRWWGVEPAMLDLVNRPEMVHAAMDRLVNGYLARLDQWERLNLLARNDGNVRIGSGGLGYVDGLPGTPFDAAHPRAHNLWGCATAQIFSEVSPAMHEEFALQYERRWLARFGLTYYGCCEPLDIKLGILASVPNLRKVSMSPWVKLDRAAERVGRRYVFSFKPNPAWLAEDTWRPDAVRAYLRDALERTRGCAVEVILKDVSTIRFQPQRLWDYARLASEEAARLAP